MTRLARLALRAYPPGFRARYGPEMEALLEDLVVTPTATADLFLGAARAWVQPPPFSTRRRLQATITTTWVAWCAGFLVSPAINRALLDPPQPGTGGAVRILVDVAYLAFFVGWAGALLGAVPIVIRVAVPALRARNTSAFRPLLPALVFGLLDVAGLLWLALASPEVVVVALWLVGCAAFTCSLAIGPALTVTRLAPVGGTRASAGLALPVALALSVLTGCSLSATMLAGDARLFGSAFPVDGALAVGCLASLVALTSSVRGARALRTGGEDQPTAGSRA